MDGTVVRLLWAAMHWWGGLQMLLDEKKRSMVWELMIVMLTTLAQAKVFDCEASLVYIYILIFLESAHRYYWYWWVGYPLSSIFVLTSCLGLQQQNGEVQR